MKNTVTMIEDNRYLHLDDGMVIDCYSFYEMGCLWHTIPEYLVGEDCDIVNIESNNMVTLCFPSFVGDFIEGSVI